MLVIPVPVGSMANVAWLIIEAAPPPRATETTAAGAAGTRPMARAIVVDPAHEVEPLLAAVREHGATVTAIVLTHHHFDHVNAATRLKATTGARILAHHETEKKLGGEPPIDERLEDGRLLTFDGTTAAPPTAGGPAGPTITVLHTPGHAPGSICLLVADRWLITGDTLFIGNCGRTDLPGGSAEALFASLQRLKALPDHLEICPGHHYGLRPTATLAEEKRTNPTLRATTLAEFMAVP